jgi:hypothetical protein
VLVGYSVLVAERWSVGHELQLIAPDAARPDEPIPVRGLVFEGIRDPEGGALAAAEITIELVGADGRAHARATLAGATNGSHEGVLAATGAALAPAMLRGAAWIDGAIVATASRAITIAPDAPALPLRGRLADPLQHLALGPVISELAGIAPPPLDVRVAGGTCVPEERCELWIAAVDADAATIEESAAASVAERASREDDLLRLVVVVHGPEAAIDLVVSRVGIPIARRSVRLPVALATPWIDAPRVAAPDALSLAVHPPPGRSDVVVDDYLGGRWIGTATIGGGEHDALPASLLRAPGLHRLQAHADPFGAEYAVARYVLIAPDADAPRDALSGTRALLAAEGVDLDDPGATHPRLLLAGAEEELRTLPVAVSGLQHDIERVAERRRRLHVIGAVALAVGIVAVVLTMLRRGLRAAAEARGVMRQAGDEAATAPATRARMTLAVVALALAVAVAFLAGAALILVRAMLVAG